MFKSRFLNIATFACDVRASRGRAVEEPESASRTAFQRDRDRIVHATAFRRLKHKTQVFVYHEGDHYRTRLTHSLEVAQIARSIARVLGLDEDLAEAVSLAHDLGHTPFGHAGETTLNACMADHGGFDHNAQTVRIVTRLERRYADFDGLNLSWETLEGLIKHNGPLFTSEGNPVARYEKAGIPLIFAESADSLSMNLAQYATLEAQAASLSDDIAYNAHDIDDGLRAGLFDIIDLADVPVVGKALNEVLAKHRDLERSRLVHETVRRMIDAMVRDLLEQSRINIEKSGVSSSDDVRTAGKGLIAFSAEMEWQNATLKKFLRQHMYRHEKVLAMTQRAQRILDDLFKTYISNPEQLPGNWQADNATEHGDRQVRDICDFIAGMTDRYALDEHHRLFDLDPLFR